MAEHRVTNGFDDWWRPNRHCMPLAGKLQNITLQGRHDLKPIAEANVFAFFQDSFWTQAMLLSYSAGVVGELVGHLAGNGSDVCCRLNPHHNLLACCLHIIIVQD